MSACSSNHGANYGSKNRILHLLQPNLTVFVFSPSAQLFHEFPSIYNFLLVHFSKSESSQRSVFLTFLSNQINIELSFSLECSSCHVTPHWHALAWPTLQVCGQIMTSSGKTRCKRQRRSDSSDETDFLQADTPDSALDAIDQLIRRFNLDPSMFKFKDDDPGPCLSLSLFRLGVLLC